MSTNGSTTMETISCSSVPLSSARNHSYQEIPLMAPAPLFHLLDLPVELQQLIIYHALEGPYDITLTYERISMLRSKFQILGFPLSSLPLLLTSRHINLLAAKLRHGLFTGRLVLDSVFILVPLRRQARFEWLRTHTRILHFSDSSVHPERWGRYFDTFEGLQKIEIEFPTVKRLERDVPLKDVLGGKEDQQLIECLDKFMVSLLGGSGLNFLITARFALGKGLESWNGIVTCDISFDSEGARILERRYAPGDGQADGGLNGTRAVIVHANGNTLSEASHRSLWEWHNAMTT